MSHPLVSDAKDVTHMAQVQLHDDLNELLDLVVTTKGSADGGVARIASSCCCSSTCCSITVISL
jgi:hypothetical protein